MAAVKKQSKRIDFRGYSKGGSRVIGVSLDEESFRIMCKCGVVYIANRVHVRNAKNSKGRNLHCEECHCRNMQRVATEAAAKRRRVGGQFAPEVA